jgi:hypothetical protein
MGKTEADKPRRTWWRVLWSFLAILIFLWSLPALPSDYKPWKSLWLKLVQHVSSTTVSWLGIVLVIALLTLINLSAIKREWAHLRHGGSVKVTRVNGYLPEERPLLISPPGWTEDSWATTSLSDDWRGPNVAEESTFDASDVPLDLSVLQPYPAPDFSYEYARFQMIDLNYSPSPDWDATIDKWVDDVYAKLEAWNSRLAQKFMEGDDVGPLGGILREHMTAMANPDLARNPKLADLHEMKRRLNQILEGRR